MEEKDLVVVEEKKTTANELTSLEADDLVIMAEQAQKRVNALKTVMTACLSMTTVHDWVLIGGKPYLQESGTTKVANLIGISFEIEPGYPKVEKDEKGYKTYIYRVRAFGKSTFVVGEGSRSASEDFFSGKGEYKKTPELVKDRDVMIAALTNAKNNAIKSLIPGLRNIEVETLKDAGIEVEKLNGYSYNTGAKGGESYKSTLKCENCNKEISQKVATFSQSKYSGHIYCVECQNLAAANKLKKTGVLGEVYHEDSEEGE